MYYFVRWHLFHIHPLMNSETMPKQYQYLIHVSTIDEYLIYDVSEVLVWVFCVHVLYCAQLSTQFNYNLMKKMKLIWNCLRDQMKRSFGYWKKLFIYTRTYPKNELFIRMQQKKRFLHVNTHWRLAIHNFALITKVQLKNLNTFQSIT